MIAFAAIASVLSIVFGSIFFVSKTNNIKKDIQFEGGIKYQVSVKNEKGENVKGSQLNDVAHALQYSFLSENNNSVSINAGGDGLINVSIPVIKDDNGNGKLLSGEGLKDFESLLTKKSSLVFTDIDMHPLFVDGLYTPNATIDYNNIDRYVVPLASNGASYKFNYYNNKYGIEAKLANQAGEIEFKKALDAVSKTADKVIFM
ncbi:UNVERIFIED_CONTAM: hypothetical protein O8I53_05325 [Campylobacter lari]